MTEAEAKQLTAERESSLADLRKIFETVRVRAYGRYVPQYEQASWRVQVEECRAFLAVPPNCGEVSTPYLDAFLSECPNRDKRTFCETILRNHDRFAVTMGRVNGVQTKFWDLILHAETSQEIRDALREAGKAAATL